VFIFSDNQNYTSQLLYIFVAVFQFVVSIRCLYGLQFILLYSCTLSAEETWTGV